jgi:serine/threonine protein kinase
VEAISSAMLIKFARLILPGHDENDLTPSDIIKASYPIKICYKNKYSLLYASNEEEFKKWVQGLTRVMTRTDFHCRYSVARIIGSGAFANVYEATEKASGKRFAVKGFNKGFLEQDTKGKQALWNELQVMRTLDQRNLLRLYEVHETKNSIYLVLDIIEGGELTKFMDKRTSGLPEGDVVRIMQGLLKGLEYMAERILTHRDIKPSNIMLRKTHDITCDDVVIVDFGLAASTKEKNLIYKRCGTPGYIAPEVIAARNVDVTYEIPEKCDVFSIGVIMYVLCAGSSPFEKPEYNVDVILKKNLEAKVDFPPTIFGKFSPQLVKLLRALLQADPKNRPTAKDALNSTLFTKNHEETDIDQDIDEFPVQETDAKSVNMSVGTIKSFVIRKGPLLETVAMSNNSIAVNSKGFLENKEVIIAGSKKLPHTNLYKQSLMKGVSSSQSRANSKDRSAENSPAHSMISNSGASSFDSSSSLNSSKSTSTKQSPFMQSEKRKVSYFAPVSKNS